MKRLILTSLEGIVLASGVAAAEEDKIGTFDPDKDLLSLHYDHAPARRLSG